MVHSTPEHIAVASFGVHMMIGAHSLLFPRCLADTQDRNISTVCADIITDVDGAVLEVGILPTVSLCL